MGANYWTFNQGSGVLTSGSAPALLITTGSTLATGTTQVAYSQTFTAVNGTPAYQWSQSGGTLPGGLTLSSQGVLSGTPSASGTFNFTVKVTDQSSNTASEGITMAVVSPLSIVTTSPLPSDIVGTAYSQTLAAAGGAGGYSWALFSGALPAGITLNSAGLLSGTPTASGTFVFVAQVTDSASSSLTRSFAIDITGLLGIATGPALGSGTLGVNYTAALSPSGGSAPYAWSLTGGALPGGMALSGAGVLSGTPGATGTFGFTATVMDQSGQSASQLFSLAVINPLAVTAAALQTGTLNAAYAQSLAATGGSPGYTWSLGSGILPAGVTLSAAGAVSGTPTATGTFSFIAKAHDSAGASASNSFSMVVVPQLSITTAGPLASGTVTYNYSQTFTAAGGQGPYTWSISGGAAPGGVNMATNGVLSGIAGTSGTYNFTAQVTDASNTSVTKAYTITIASVLMPNGTVGKFVGLIDRDPIVNGNLGGRLDMTTTALGAVTGKITQQGKSHSFKGTVTPSNGSEPVINITVANGKLPSLLLAVMLDGTSGQLTGTVTTNGTSAAVNGWRQVYDKKINVATALEGYYSFILALSDTNDQGVSSIPQGNGYATFTVAADGSLTVKGKTADGQTFATAGFAGPDGQVAVYQSLYANAGSMLGTLALDTDAITGSLSWLKPVSKSRTYAAGFGPAPLAALGGYLAPSSSKHVVQGLPNTAASAELLFGDGGIAEAAINPDVNAFTFTAANKVVMPTGAGNPAKATLTINAATGAVSGKLTLVDGKLTRHVSYQGVITPTVGGGVEAAGYFLLPQIPTAGETSSNSPLLSGLVTIQL